MSLRLHRSVIPITSLFVMSASSLPEWKEDGPKSRQLWVNIIAGRNLKAADSNGPCAISTKKFDILVSSR